jgi:hypothetical protein
VVNIGLKLAPKKEFGTESSVKLALMDKIKK